MESIRQPEGSINGTIFLLSVEAVGAKCGMGERKGTQKLLTWFLGQMCSCTPQELMYNPIAMVVEIS